MGSLRRIWDSRKSRLLTVRQLSGTTLHRMTQPNTTTDENPYAVSLTCQGDVDVRKPDFGREHLAQLIRTYMAGGSSAQQFRTEISPYDADEPDDKSTTWVAEQMGMLIYENSDDTAAWPRERWNFAQ